METHYSPTLVIASVVVAILASYTALDLSSSVAHAKGSSRALWLASGSFAMGVGIWSMHFVGMLSFRMPGVIMSYDVTLMILSVLIAIGASCLALYVVSHFRVTTPTFVLAGLAMGVAIAGMHYTGMASMRMPARIVWNYQLVFLSVLIAVMASLAALRISFRLRNELQASRIKVQVIGGVLMGSAISGMHYTGMAAATFVQNGPSAAGVSRLIATSSLGIIVIGSTLLILGMALVGSIVEREFARRAAIAEKGRHLYQQAENAIAALQEERTLRDHFVSSLTHDLRTPLTAAKLNALLLEKKMRGVEFEDKKYLFKIVDGIDRADSMIHDLLDVQRISGNQALPVKAMELDLVELLQRTIQGLQSAYGDRFTLQSPPSLVGRWDAKYLQRLVENLCSNAVKYGAAGTPVSVTLADLESEVEIRVHNSGDPITPEDRVNLFKLFHRSIAAKKSGNVGWGIGLTLVKGVAESHGGRVQVRSGPNEGTTFVVRLPKNAPSATLASA